MNIIIVFSSFIVIFSAIELFLKKNEYECKIVIVPEDAGSSGLSGSLAGLAGLAGVNLNSLSDNGTVLTPEIYPKILKSTVFYYALTTEKFKIPKFSEELTIEEYFEREGSVSILQWIIGSPFSLLEYLKGSSDSGSNSNTSTYIRLSKDELKLKESLNQRIKVNVDIQSNVIDIKVEMTDSYLATEVANFVLRYITTYVVEYRTMKEENNLVFIERSLAEAEVKFKDAQIGLSNFQDKNRNLSTENARSEEKYLLSLYDLHFGVYSTLSQEYERAKIQLQEKKPVFKVIEPAVVPTLKTGPKRLLLIIAFSVLSVVLCVSFFAFKFIISTSDML